MTIKKTMIIQNYNYREKEKKNLIKSGKFINNFFKKSILILKKKKSDETKSHGEVSFIS